MRRHTLNDPRAAPARVALFVSIRGINALTTNVEKDRLVAFLLGDHYRHLLVRALLARLATTSNNNWKHGEALRLLEAAYPGSVAAVAS